MEGKHGVEVWQRVRKPNLMEIQMKGTFRFRSSSFLLTSWSHVRQALLRQTDQASREGICSLEAQVENVVCHDPRDFWHSPAICPSWLCFGLAVTRSKRTAWNADLSTAQETAGRKQRRFPASLVSYPAPDHREGSYQLQTALQPIKAFFLDSNF